MVPNATSSPTTFNTGDRVVIDGREYDVKSLDVSMSKAGQFTANVLLVGVAKPPEVTPRRGQVWRHRNLETLYVIAYHPGSRGFRLTVLHGTDCPDLAGCWHGDYDPVASAPTLVGECEFYAENPMAAFDRLARES